MAALAGCGATGGSGSTSATSGADGELTTVRVAAMTNNCDHYYAIIGEETGIYEEYGLDVEVTEFAAGVNTVDAITTGQADIGCLADYALVNRIGNTASDTDLRVVTRFATSDPDSNHLYVNPDVISELSDLEGNSIVTLTGTVWDYFCGITLDAAGLTSDDVEILEVDSAQSALAVMTSGEGTAFWASGVNARKLEEAGMEPLISLADLGSTTDQYYIATESFATDSADVLATFFEATAAIEDYLDDNPDDSAEIIATALDVDTDDIATTLEALTFTLDFTTETLEHLDDIQEWAIGAGSFTEAYDMADFTSLDVLRELYPDAVEI